MSMCNYSPCEEYVVNRVKELEAEVKALRAVIEQNDALIEKANEFANAIQRNATFRKRDEGLSVISFDNIFEKYDTDAFNIIVSFLDLGKDAEAVEE